MAEWSLAGLPAGLRAGLRRGRGGRALGIAERGLARRGLQGLGEAHLAEARLSAENCVSGKHIACLGATFVKRPPSPEPFGAGVLTSRRLGRGSDNVRTSHALGTFADASSVGGNYANHTILHYDVVYS